MLGYDGETVIQEIRDILRCIPIAKWSVMTALKEQNLLPLYKQLSIIVPDITHQYSSVILKSEYIKLKARGQQAFQINLVNQALEIIDNSRDDISIVDIGDSSGTHIEYIKALHKDKRFHSLSINIDSEAIKKIRLNGLEAYQSRAEDYARHYVDANILLSFAVLEHLINPCGYLHDLSENTNCKAYVITVPYMARSKMGLSYIRKNQERKTNAENTHIFELSPDDWHLLFQYSGWGVLRERIYYQYPRKSILSMILKNFWRRNDFEGFYGVILKPDNTWSKLYADW